MTTKYMSAESIADYTKFVEYCNKKGFWGDEIYSYEDWFREVQDDN